MKKQITKFLSVVLSVFLTIGVINPMFVFAGAAGVVGDKYDFSSYDTHRNADLISANWANAMKNGFSIYSSSNICVSTGLTDASGSYADNDGVIYKLKQLDNATAVITDIALPIGYREVTIPEIVTVYLLASSAVVDNPLRTAGMIYSENEGLPLFWDFSHELTEKTVGEEQINRGKNFYAEQHTYQIVGVETSFAGDVVVDTVVFPEIITTIESGAFKDNHYIKNVYAPKVTEIRSSAFYDCNELTYAEFPLVRYVENQAFYQCNKLLDFNFSSIVRIGNQAFYDCVKFKEVTLCENINALGTNAFEKCTGITKVTIPEGVSINSIPKACFSGCTSLQQISMPKEIIQIADNAFYGCAGLLDLTFPENLDTIGAKAFWGCISLDHIVLPERVVSFSSNAFDNCTGLRFVYFTSDLSDTQVKQLKASSIGKCVVLPKENMGVQLWDKNSNVNVGKSIMVYGPTTFDVYDTVDIKNISVTPEVEVKMSFSDAHKNYKTTIGTISITEPGTYSILVTDMFDKQETLTIEYKKLNKYSVIYDGNGATGGTMAKQDFVIGESAKLNPNAFVKESNIHYEFQNGKAAKTVKYTYSFLGWTNVSNGSRIYNDNQTITDISNTAGDIVVLYAVWYNGSAKFEDAGKKDNSVFKGWNTLPDGSGEYITSIQDINDAEITIYAIWEGNKYTVRYNGNGSNGGMMTDDIFLCDETYNLSDIGYTKTNKVTLHYNNGIDADSEAFYDSAFAGWAQSAGGSVAYENMQEVKNLTTTNNKVINLYARWDPATVVLGVPEREGYTFAGWYSSSLNVSNGIDEYKVTKDIVLEAHWNPITYHIKYYFDGQLYSQSNCKYDSIYSINSLPSKVGYKTTGWNTEEDMSGRMYAPSEKFNNLTAENNGDICFYATTTPIQYFIRYNANSANIGEMSSDRATYDEDTVLSVNTYKKGYEIKYVYDEKHEKTVLAEGEFLGWATSSTGEAVYSDAATVKNLAKTQDSIANLYAKWGTVKIYLDTPERAGYKFLGWNTKADGKGTYVGDMDGLYKPTKAITLYAIWEREFEPGDVDMDGYITSADARLALRASVGLENLSEIQSELADYDNDNEISSADARLILRKSVGLED